MIPLGDPVAASNLPSYSRVLRSNFQESSNCIANLSMMPLRMNSFCRSCSGACLSTLRFAL